MQNQFAREAILFIRNDPFQEGQPQASRSARISAPSPTNDSRSCLQKLPLILEALFQEGYEYKKAGFVLMDLCGGTGFQGDQLTPQALPETSPVMTVIDAINRKYGSSTIRGGFMGFEHQNSHMNQKSLSQHYTTRWSDILEVKT